MFGTITNAQKTHGSSVRDFLINDLWEAIRNPRPWIIMANRNVRNVNRRSQLGMIWIVLSSLIFVAVLSIVYSVVFNVKTNELMPYIAVGYTAWMLISGLVTSMATLFISAKSYLTQRSMPLTIFVLSNAYEKIQIFLFQLLVMFLVCLWFGVGISFSLLILPFSILIYATTAVGMSFVIAPIAVRYRDVAQIINSLMLLVFLVTPILWKVEFVEGRAIIIDLNPFYHYIQIVRAPIIDHTVPVASLSITVLIAVVSCIVGVMVMTRYRHRIVFWL